MEGKEHHHHAAHVAHCRTSASAAPRCCILKRAGAPLRGRRQAAVGGRLQERLLVALSWPLPRVRLRQAIEKLAPFDQRLHADALVESVCVAGGAVAQHAGHAIGRNARGREEAAVGGAGR